MSACYCGSGQNFAQCCQPLLQGLQHASAPEQLMRSRFSAYCCQHVDYIANTYHHSQHSSTARQEIADFAHAASFLDLQIEAASPITPIEVVANQQQLPVDAEAVATVSFKVRFIFQDKLQHLIEQSRFVRCAGRWFYLDGQLAPTAATKISRNELCPCGSGKKYKVCTQHKYGRATDAIMD
jgi:SEC-C motif-containing protein